MIEDMKQCWHESRLQPRPTRDMAFKMDIFFDQPHLSPRFVHKLCYVDRFCMIGEI